VREVPVDSALLAYLTEGRYEPPRPAAAARMVVARRGPAARALYGRDLMAEVERYAGAAAAVARREAFDVVHAHDWMTWPAGIEAAAASGRPLVVHVHSCEHDRSGSRGSARVEAVEQRGLDAADAIVCVSHYAARTIARRYRVDGSKLRVVHNGVEIPSRARRPVPRSRRPRSVREPVVLFLGRVTRQKGPDAFLDAAARVARARPETTFVVAGHGDRLPGLVERAAAMGLSRRVRFTGFLEGEDLERAFAMADVLVVPSVSEPFGIAPLEAAVRGVPVVLSRQSGVAEVLPGAAVADAWDAEDLAAQVLRLLSDRRAARRAGRRASAAARRLRWVDAAQGVRDVYDEVAGLEVAGRGGGA
jgi:glycosyltransferase involved in cell wall biosynthesis